MFWCFAALSFAQDMKIRVLALKHSKEQMAQGDQDLAFRNIEKAKEKGLDIKPIGGHWVNKDGEMRVKAEGFENIDQFRQFVSERMKVDAEYGDTLVIFTIGHGAASGYLDNLGQRGDVLKAIGQAAQENEQRTLWWQLSCHAAARLPDITTLPEAQQELLSIVCSSSAAQLSPAGVEGELMGRVFVALAEKSKAIDPDQDEEVNAQEFQDFLRSSGTKRADLFFVARKDLLIFGGLDLANQIPIKDRNNPQGKYPRGYIPRPKK
jgi:hypothetical protein